MRKKTLSTFDDLCGLGKYEFFNTKIDKERKKIFFSLRKDRKQHTWLARPIDAVNRMDADANTFFLLGKDGAQGIVFRKENNRFRIVPLHRPIKIIPKVRRKFRDRGKLKLRNTR